MRASIGRAASVKAVGGAVLMLGLLAMLWGSQAVATAREVKADRSDNTYFFSYDAADGTIGTASSSLQERRRDPVSQRIYVDAVPGAAVGERLRAAVNFRLNSKEKRRFSGAVSLEIRDATGRVVFEGTKDVDFTLRPRSGSRGNRLVFRFDLPSGDYAATSMFKAATS